MGGGAGGRRVLVVEDHPDLRERLKDVLETLGCEVQVASDGEEALAALQGAPPDLVCLDLCLPEISGYEVCDHLRATPGLESVPVLVISGRALPMDRAFAAEAGATAFLGKPFELADFEAEVRRLLGTPPLQIVAA